MLNTPKFIVSNYCIVRLKQWVSWINFDLMILLSSLYKIHKQSIESELWTSPCYSWFSASKILQREDTSLMFPLLIMPHCVLCFKALAYFHLWYLVHIYIQHRKILPNNKIKWVDGLLFIILFPSLLWMAYFFKYCCTHYFLLGLTNIDNDLLQSTLIFGMAKYLWPCFLVILQ